jgi:hypothetical protein
MAVSARTQREEADAFLKQMEQFADTMKQSIGVPLVFDPKTQVALWFDQRLLPLRFIISVEKIRKFFEGLAEGKILATKCKKTGKIYFPPQVDCPDAPDSEVEWVSSPRRASS